MIYYHIEQDGPGDNWEPIVAGESATLAEARASLSSLETELGWRGLRIAEYEETDTCVRRKSVVEYGQDDSDDSDESTQPS